MYFGLPPRLRLAMRVADGGVSWWLAARGSEMLRSGDARRCVASCSRSPSSGDGEVDPSLDDDDVAAVDTVDDTDDDTDDDTTDTADESRVLVRNPAWNRLGLLARSSDDVSPIVDSDSSAAAAAAAIVVVVISSRSSVRLRDGGVGNAGDPGE